MTREAKIGMLTGLGVILLIGVLLSNYLGGAGGGMSPTGRMATLPLGAAYRQEVTEPVGVPGTVRSEGMVAEAGTVVSAGQPMMPLPAGGVAAGEVMNANNNGNGPTVGAAVTPVPAGDVRMDEPLGAGSLPTLQLPEGGAGVQAVYIAGQQKAVAAGGVAPGRVTLDAKPVAAKGQEYVIATGDTLGKIAAKFYKTSKGDGVARIVAANPLMLKNDKSVLLAGKKLMIPDAPVAAKVVSTVAAGGPVVANVKKGGTMVIHQPGASGAKGADVAVVKADSAKKVTAKVYVVVAGDTFEKIAKRLAPSGVSAMVKKLEAMNGNEDPSSLKVGEKLKVPV